MSSDDKRQKDSDEINQDDYDTRGEVPILKSPDDRLRGTALMALYRECFYEVFPGCAGETPVLQVMALRLFAERLGAQPSAMTQTQHRYAAPFNMHGKETEWVQTRFVAREHIKDKPTEANPSPIRVILLGELERAQPHAMAFGRDGVSDEVNVAHDRALGKGSRNK